MSQLLRQEPERVKGWLRLAAPPGAQQYDQASTRIQREKLRRAKLTAYLAPFIFVAPLFFIQQALVDPGTAIGMLVVMGAATVAVILNRLGNQTLAALLLIFSLDTIVEGTLITAPGGLGNGWILSFDLFLFPLLVSGVLLQRQYIWMFSVFHIGMILGDFYLLPHSSDLIALIKVWGPTVVFVRPIILQIGCGLICWLSIRSTDDAIARADRAELIANLQESIVRQKSLLDEGIQELVRALTSAANGNYSQVSLSQDHTLWQISAALNILFGRLQSGRQKEQQAQQLLRELQTITALVQSAHRGEIVQWPTATGSILDPLIRELRLLFPGPVPSSYVPRKLYPNS